MRQKLDLAMDLNQLPCALTAPANIHSCLWVSVLKQARRIHANSLMVKYFTLGSQGAMACFMATVYVMQLPAVATGVQVLWVSWVVVPLLAVPLLASAPDDDIMHQISPKNEADKQSTCGGTATVRRILKYFALRFMPSALVSALIFAMCVADLADSNFREVIFQSPLSPGSDWDVTREIELERKDILAWPRAASLWFFVVYLCLHSGSFVHRTESWWVNALYRRNLVWCSFALLVLVLQTIYTVLALVVQDRTSDIASMSWPTAVLGFGWPIVLYILDTIAKRHDGKKGYGREYDDFGRELWLDFHTKLGMHSPV